MSRQEVPEDPQPENSKFWKPKIGDSTEGLLVRSEDGKFGEQFVIQRPDSTEQVLPADTHLMQKLRKVKLGVYVWISMIGEKDIGRPKPMKVYKVEHDPDYKLPVATKAPSNEGQDLIVASIIKDLKFAQGFFQGPIPEQNTLQCIKKFCMGSNAGKEAEILQLLKTKGLVQEVLGADNNSQGYIVV